VYHEKYAEYNLHVTACQVTGNIYWAKSTFGAKVARFLVAFYGCFAACFIWNVCG